MGEGRAVVDAKGIVPPTPCALSDRGSSIFEPEHLRGGARGGERVLHPISLRSCYSEQLGWDAIFFNGSKHVGA